MTLDLEAEPAEDEPLWADMTPPGYGRIRAGVRYTGLQLGDLVPLLRDLDVVRVYAAMGPGLFWGRSDGPWVPWDPEIRDQNEDRFVRERRCPWDLGDVLWLAGRWEGMPTSVRLSRLGRLDDCDLYCAVATGRLKVEQMTEAVRRRALRTAKHVVAIRLRDWRARLPRISGPS